LKRVDHWRTVAALALSAMTSMVLADEGSLKALAQGGHVILVRHAAISGHAKALALDPSGNCANEENLSEQGRAQATRLKSMLDRAGVKFDLVLTSPYCRAKETAQLAFGRATVDTNLTALENGTQEQALARSKAITELLAGRVGKGSIAMVTHRPNIDALTLELVDEGEAVVARIQPGGDLDVVGRIRP
jgi:phosphohistidine phosphatase SixA